MLIGVTVLTFGIAAILTVPILAVKYLANVTCRFELEAQRLRMQRGLLMRSDEEIELFRVKDVKATYSLVQQLFGTGKVEIISSDLTGTEKGGRRSFVIDNVENARAIREELRSRVVAARKLHGVREIDLA